MKLMKFFSYSQFKIYNDIKFFHIAIKLYFISYAIANTKIQDVVVQMEYCLKIKFIKVNSTMLNLSSDSVLEIYFVLFIQFSKF